MKRVGIIIAVMTASLLLTAGVAFAAQIACKGGTCVGTDRKDRMVGTVRHDTMFGKADSDTMYGRLLADKMFGGFGSDVMYGGEGNDEISGGHAHDRIFGGPGLDTMNGDTGSDFIHAAGDGRPDSISCGVGNDTAVVDEVDLKGGSFEDFVRLTSCEDLRVR